MKKDTRYITIKTIANILLIVIGLLMMINILQAMQNETSRRRQQRTSFRILDEVIESIQSNESDAEDLTRIYHESNQAALNDLSYLLSSGLFDSVLSSNREERSTIFSDIVTMVDAKHLYMVNPAGRVILTNDASMAGKNLTESGIMTDDELKELIASAKNESDVNVEPMLITNAEGSYYFYTARYISAYKNTYYLILGDDSSILNTQLASLNDVSSIIRNTTVSGTGFVFAVDKKTGDYIWFDNGNQILTGKSATSSGLSNTALTDRYAGVQNIAGTNYYCVSRSYGDYTVLVAAVASTELYSSNSKVVFWSATLFVMVALVSLLYALFVRKSQLSSETESDFRLLFHFGKSNALMYNRKIMRKVFPVMLVGLCLLFGVTYYVQTLLALNNAINESTYALEEIKIRIDDRQQFRNTIKTYYEDRYLAKARLLAYILEEDPSALNNGTAMGWWDYDENGIRQKTLDSEGNQLSSITGSAILQSLCDTNGMDAIFIYDEQGRVISTNTANWYFALSQNEADQSYPFRQVLEGKTDHLVQKQMIDESNTTSQYIGTSFQYYTYTDDNGKTIYASKYDYQNQESGQWTGNPITAHLSLIQIGMKSDIMERVLATTELSYIFKNINVDENGFLMALDNSSDHVMLYSPKESSIGQTSEELKISDRAFSGNYNGFTNINGVDYFQCYRFYNGYYIATAIPLSNLYAPRLPLAVITELIGFLFIAIMSVTITLTTKQEEELFKKLSGSANNASTLSFFTIIMPNGQKKISTAAADRYSGKRIPWSEKSPQQKLIVLMGACGILIAFYLVLTVLVAKSLFGEQSIITYILGDEWDKGMNPFAYSKCLMTIAAVMMIVRLLSRLIIMATRVFGSKSETMGQLLISFIRYGSAVATVFYCMALVGFDTTSLIASLGIFSMIVGFGAQSLISDILAGISIVFEGEFRVGDIVTVDDFRGQVLEIGLRTTKLMDVTQNIKIFNNSKISSVLNMTREASYAFCEVGIDYNEDIRRVEAILKKELPALGKRLGKPVFSTPEYVGVKSLSDSSVIIQLKVKCAEKDRVAVSYSLNKEIFILFQENNISIPFPQVTVSNRD